MRESPSLHIIRILRERGAEVAYYDPHIPVSPTLAEHPEVAGMSSVAWSQIGTFDAAIIATDHDAVDYRELAETLPLIIDTRNATARLNGAFADKIRKA
jgi:UDP-N-acetyl-D-glucosamine dehydrogenase